MPVQLPITTYGMDVLRKTTNPVEKIDNNIIELIDNMFYTMINAYGIGLAAPQVNSELSVCLVDISCIDEYKDVKPLILINPVVLDSYGESTKDEGCLSIPDVRAEITRPDKIYLKYNDFNMNEVKIEIEGFLSRVAQHEIDHLHGKLFVDYLSKESLSKVKSQLRKIQKRKVETDYPLFEN
ncbi:MAG: peptide deformylase [Ignavibacteriae bacterium]|nr:peptide deformylase [Ignavibacteriota bacterium]